MIITYHGAEFVKVQHGDLVVAFNPPSKNSSFKAPKFGSDVVCISANHKDFNGVDTVSRKDREPFVINGPGEYELSGLFIEGFPSVSQYDKGERVNTIFTTTIDGMRIGYFGAISEKDISAEVKEKIGDIDIMFVPIGGKDVLGPQEAYQFSVKREPKIIIPIHFGSIGEKGVLNEFLKEGGAEGVKAVDKLTIKSRDIDGKSGDIVVLKEVN